jgi:hypothetical protein
MARDEPDTTTSATPATPGANGAAESPGMWSRLAELAWQAVPAIASAIGVVTFVALIGGAIQWIRFTAAGIPADQAVRVMPKQELVTIGAVSLVSFMLAGLVTVLVVFLIDKRGNATTPTLRGLVGLTVVGMVVTLFFIDLSFGECVLLGIWFVAMGLVVERTLSGVPPLLRGRTIRDDLKAAMARLEAAEDAATDAEYRLSLTPPLADAERDDSLRRQTTDAQLVALQEVELERHRAQREWNRALDRWVETPDDDAEIVRRRATAEELRREPPRTEKRLEERLDAAEEGGHAKRERIRRQRRQTGGWAVLLLVVIAGGAVPLLMSDSSRWLLAVLAVIAFLAAVDFMIARATTRFAWYGLAVFMSVIFFGAALSIARTLRVPKVQPVALVRTGDAHPICGIYVTETDKRVYVGRVEPEPGSARAVENKGRVFWVDDDDVDVVTVGPLQRITRANARSRELAKELLSDRPDKAAAAPKSATQTKTVKVGGGEREETVTTVTELPAAEAPPAGHTPPQPPRSSCEDPSP